MAIGDVRPQELHEQDQPSSSTLVHSPTQDDGHVPQEEERDQRGAQEEHVMEEEAPRAPPTQVRATIRRNHPVGRLRAYDGSRCCNGIVNRLWKNIGVSTLPETHLHIY